MTLRLLLFAAVLAVLAPPKLAGAPAQVRLYSESLRFHPATVTAGGETFTFELTSADQYAEINGELMPVYDETLPTHASLFRIRTPGATVPITGQIAFDQALFADANTNGWDDFYEVSQSVSFTSSGLFATPIDNGAVTATWSRPAGSRTGTCRLRMTGVNFGQLPDFTSEFELTEYTGTLDYIKSTNRITATMQLTQTGLLTNTLFGALTITREATNRFNFLRVLPGSLLQSDGQVLVYGSIPMLRDPEFPTNYFGFVTFADGDPSTSTIDYIDWVLSVDDAADANNNGIPDFSDDLVPAPPPEQFLTLALGSGELLLTIRAEVGTRYELERTASLNPPSWVPSAQFTITNSIQILSLPIPSTSPTFWRVRAPGNGPGNQAAGLPETFNDSVETNVGVAYPLLHRSPALRTQ